MHTAILVLIMAAVTMLTRFLPFLMIRKETPAYIAYLGRVLPPAIIGMLVVYCLKDIDLTVRAGTLPALAASLGVVLLHVWKRNAIVSILVGTAIYMVMVQVICRGI